jgi:hypothetical protein
MVGKQEVIARVRAIVIDPSQKIYGMPWSLCASVGLQSKKRFRTINVESSPFSRCSPLSRSEGKMKSSKFPIRVVSNVVRGQFGEPQIRRLEEACGAALES